MTRRIVSLLHKVSYLVWAVAAAWVALSIFITFDLAGIPPTTPSLAQVHANAPRTLCEQIVAAVLAVLAIWQFRYQLGEEREAQCRKQNLCPTCGYDLRATPNRCPECGTPAIVPEIKTVQQ
jgi:hypothetical protein